MTAETIAGLCQAVKEASQGRMLTGAFYGYLLELCGSERLVNSGHLGFGKLLESPAVDFLAAPTGYCFREAGGAGIPYQMAPTASLRLHGKFWWVEMDVRTSDTHAPPGYAGKGRNVQEDLLSKTRRPSTPSAPDMPSGGLTWATSLSKTRPSRSACKGWSPC